MNGIKGKIVNKNRTQITVVLGIVLEKGKILMSQRFEPECPAAHLKWELPGGKIAFNEEPEVTVKREIFEETGVKVSVRKLIPIIRTCTWDYTDGREQHTILIGFKCKFIKQILHKKRDHHVEKFEWVKISDVKKLDTLPGDLEFIKKALYAR